MTLEVLFAQAAQGRTFLLLMLCGLIVGVLVQLTNVKIMIYCLTAMSGYVLPYSRDFRHLLAVGLFLPFTGPVCNLLWLFPGGSLQKFNGFPLRRRNFYATMG